MGKVKQAIQEVEETILALVEQELSLSQIKATIGYVKDLDLCNKNNPYFFDTKLVETCYNKAIWERDNGEEYWG